MRMDRSSFFIYFPPPSLIPFPLTPPPSPLSLPIFCFFPQDVASKLYRHEPTLPPLLLSTVARYHAHIKQHVASSALAGSGGSSPQAGDPPWRERRWGRASTPLKLKPLHSIQAAATSVSASAATATATPSATATVPPGAATAAPFGGSGGSEALARVGGKGAAEGSSIRSLRGVGQGASHRKGAQMDESDDETDKGDGASPGGNDSNSERGDRGVASGRIRHTMDLYDTWKAVKEGSGVRRRLMTGAHSRQEGGQGGTTDNAENLNPKPSTATTGLYRSPSLESGGEAPPAGAWTVSNVLSTLLSLLSSLSGEEVEEAEGGRGGEREKPERSLSSDAGATAACHASAAATAGKGPHATATLAAAAAAVVSGTATDAAAGELINKAVGAMAGVGNLPRAGNKQPMRGLPGVVGVGVGSAATSGAGGGSSGAGAAVGGAGSNRMSTQFSLTQEFPREGGRDVKSNKSNINIPTNIHGSGSVIAASPAATAAVAAAVAVAVPTPAAAAAATGAGFVGAAGAASPAVAGGEKCSGSESATPLKLVSKQVSGGGGNQQRQGSPSVSARKRGGEGGSRWTPERMDLARKVGEVRHA